MDLAQAAWMIRDLSQPVSAIDLDQDSNLIAGGWDGSLKKWNADGDLLWTAQCQDRIESILRIENSVIVTTGLHISLVQEGEIKWSHALEGSADLLAFHDGNVVATSSVYDIEHGDFMESAIWKFSIDGELLDVVRFDERPWFMHADDNLTLGLGRPKCGALVNGKHQSLASDYPVTCGTAISDKILFGHADGAISNADGTKLSNESAAIESLSCTNEFFVAALESGDLVSYDFKSNQLWKSQGAPVTTQSLGFSGLHWCGRWNGMVGVVEVRDQQGQIIVDAETSRPRVSTSIEDRIAIGFEDGQILVWEKKLFERRLEEKPTNTNERKSALAAKLRSLRE